MCEEKVQWYKMAGFVINGSKSKLIGFVCDQEPAVFGGHYMHTVGLLSSGLGPIPAQFVISIAIVEYITNAGQNCLSFVDR